MKRTIKRTSIERGQFYEDQALEYLMQQGLQLVTRNYTCRFGEIDLILLDKGELVFVEVRMRRLAYYGGAASSVDYTKRTKLERAGQNYIVKNYAQGGIPLHRFDLIAIDGDKLSWIKGFNIH